MIINFVQVRYFMTDHTFLSKLLVVLAPISYNDHRNMVRNFVNITSVNTTLGPQTPQVKNVAVLLTMNELKL